MVKKKRATGFEPATSSLGSRGTVKGRHSNNSDARSQPTSVLETTKPTRRSLRFADVEQINAFQVICGNCQMLMRLEGADGAFAKATFLAAGFQVIEEPPINGEAVLTWLCPTCAVDSARWTIAMDLLNDLSEEAT